MINIFQFCINDLHFGKLLLIMW